MSHAELIAETLATASAPCVTSSFQIEDVVLLHMLRAHDPSIPVLFIDTVHHFRETLGYGRRLSRDWNLRLVELRAREPARGLWRTDTDACCARHKVEPLFAALEAYDVWFTALRREQSPSRAHIQEVEEFRLPTGHCLRRVSPLAGWTGDDLREYTRAWDIPVLSLYDRGYCSIGCEPCTTVPADPRNPRSGRWQGQKVECGIHVQHVSSDPPAS